MKPATNRMKHYNRKKYALFVGRWQPFHNGHKYIIDKALSESKNVCIAIRDTEISENNPYTAFQRAEMIKRVYGDKVKIITIPDIESINIGRNVGYKIIRMDAPKDIEEISGVNVRNGQLDSVPKEVADYRSTLSMTIWLTGLPCSGKTTIAKRLKEELNARGHNAVHIDADEIREGLNKDLGFSEESRKENLRRAAHVARLFNNNGNIVIASFITPTNSIRSLVKEIIGNIKLVYVKCSLKECEIRDTKSLYKKARLGFIKEFTGISATFEEPEKADIVVDSEKNNVNDCVKIILSKLKF